jgi:hypothetical protein
MTDAMYATRRTRAKVRNVSVGVIGFIVARAPRLQPDISLTRLEGLPL